VDILQVKPENRYEEELSFLRKAFKDIEVFQQLECDMDSSSFAKVFRALRSQTAKAGEKVINVGITRVIVPLLTLLFLYR
jgi:hypothetical protein